MRVCECACVRECVCVHVCRMGQQVSDLVIEEHVYRIVTTVVLIKAEEVIARVMMMTWVT